MPAVNEAIPKKSRTPVRVTAAERRWIKKATARLIRRAAKRDPRTPLGLDTRSRVRGWAD